MTQKNINHIRRMYYDDRLGVEQIAARKGYCTATIYKYLKADYTPPEPYIPSKDNLMDKYEPIIREWLVEDKKHYYRQRHSARRVYDRMHELNPTFNVSYKTVQRTYKKILEQIYTKAENINKAVMSPGCAEIGCASLSCEMNGKTQTVYMLMLAFPHSKASYVQIIKGLNTECILSGLQDIYSYLGGVPPYQMFLPSTKLYKYYQQMLSDITDELLVRFILYYEFNDDYFVPDSEGSYTTASALIRYYRRRLFSSKPRINNLDEYNLQLLQECTKLLNRYPGDNPKTTVKVLHEDDLIFLQPLPAKPYNIIRWIKRKISKMAELRIDKTIRYYLPAHMKDRTVNVCSEPKSLDELIIK